MPWVAKHLLRSVLSTTPGNFFAEYTTNGAEKQEARTGALPVLIAPDGIYIELGSAVGVLGAPGAPTFTNEKRRL
jgi:hypothetical protein